MNNKKDNDPDINRKRKNNHDFQIPKNFSSPEKDVKDLLALSLALNPPGPSPNRPRTHSPAQHQQQQQPTQPHPSPTHPSLTMQFQPFLEQQPPPPPSSHNPNYPRPGPDSSSQQPIMLPVFRPEPPAGPSRPARNRRNASQEPRDGKISEAVPAPFPWATTHRATIHSFQYLLSKQIFSIKGEVQCKRCDRQYDMDFDLRIKFAQVWNFIAENKSGMHDRAPGVWMNPVLPSCSICDQENCVKPIIPEDKDAINWLFLLLGQMLGCCTLEQLKYFCKHTKNHRTGAKDRVLFLTYLGLCKQLDPNGPFDR